MAHATKSVTIARPIEEVFDFLADGTNNTKWRPPVVEIARSGGPDGVGATYKQGLKGPGGRRIDGDYRVTTFDRPQELAFQVTAGPAKPSGRYQLSEPTGGQTTVQFELDFQPRGLQKLMGPMIQRTMESEVALLERLKAVLENSG
jgi:uncharacterized protein YndB with AHSA1/START domain